MAAGESIAITGMGLVTALGDCRASHARKMQRGEHGFSTVTLPSTHPDQSFRAASLQVPAHLKVNHCLDHAVKEALAEAGLKPPKIKDMGLFVGTTTGFFWDYEQSILDQFMKSGPYQVENIRRGVGEFSLALAQRFGLEGPIFSYSTACTSSAIALLMAAAAIRTRKLERAMVVGFDLITHLTMYGFRSLYLYSRSEIAPFDANRDGMQIGDGCGVIILERRPQGAAKFLLGGGENYNDSSHVTASSEDGAVVETVLRRTMAASGLAKDQVKGLKAHGTGTGENDLAEGRGILRTFANTPPPFGSLKGYFGHTLGAAGAVETVAYLSCLEAGFIPASLGFQTVDQSIKATPLRNNIAAEPGHYLMAFFGFGGSCTAFDVEFLK